MRISIGKSRKDVHWKVKDVKWEDLCEMLLETVRTKESVAEYKAMDKTSKAEVKDIGGFVGGVVENGRRTKASVTARSLITLDADYADKAFIENAELLSDNAMCIYSTHSHTPSAPRLRVVMPLSREVSVEEYEPIARMVASDLGIEQFDVTTYEANRLMYWPSTPRDGEYSFRVVEGPPVNADEILNRYANWHDVTTWPTSSLEPSVRIKSAKAQGDPTSKPGLVGVFCRAYDVPSAIEHFLPDVYEPCEGGGRYTYIGGTSTAGVVIYQDGQFAYSHHATDPANGMLCNAFDLVRVHKFGDLDYAADSETPVNKLPSYQRMCELVQEDDVCKELLVTERMEGAKEAFADTLLEENEADWKTKLQLSKSGAVEATTHNLVVILENDPNLKGCLAKNLFTNRLCIVDSLPWRRCDDAVNGSPWSDEDDSNLRHYIETVYGISNKSKLEDATIVTMNHHSFHPVRDYLNALTWDGEQRAETLFIDYFGAEDNLYTREVTRKWLTAAVARIMKPGCKFDNMIVLTGQQGIGKSHMGDMLGKGWYSDTFNTVQGKEAYEQLKGVWIIEMAELSAMKKAEVEGIKLFISKQEDNYRAAYGRFAQSNKRQCVFYGTTNVDDFLRDRTGNRRFWPIKCGETQPKRDVFSITPAYIDMVWAEAKVWYDEGERLYLDAEVAKLAAEEQLRYQEDDPRTGVIEEYLDKPIPANWDDMSNTDRRNYIQGFLQTDVPLVRRDTMSVVEMAYELYGKTELTTWEARDFHNIMRGVPGWVKTGKRKRSKYYGTQYLYEREGTSNED